MNKIYKTIFTCVISIMQYSFELMWALACFDVFSATAGENINQYFVKNVGIFKYPAIWLYMILLLLFSGSIVICIYFFCKGKLKIESSFILLPMFLILSLVLLKYALVTYSGAIDFRNSSLEREAKIEKLYNDESIPSFFEYNKSADSFNKDLEYYQSKFCAKEVESIKPIIKKVYELK